MATFLFSPGPFWTVTAHLYDSIIPKSGILIQLAVDACVTTVHRLVEYYFGLGFGGIGTGGFGVGLKSLEANVRSALDSLHSSDKKQLRLDAPSPTGPLGETTDAREVGFNEVVFDNLDQTEQILNVVSAVDEFGIGLNSSSAESEQWTKHAQDRVNAGVGCVLLALLVGGWVVFMLMPESSNLDVDLTSAITDSAESDDEGRGTLTSHCNGVNVENAKGDAGRSLPRRDSSGKPDSNDNDADPDDDDGDDNDPPPPPDSGPGLHEDDSSDRVGWKFLGGRFVLGYMAAGVWKVVRRLKAKNHESLVAPVRKGDQQGYEIELDYAPEWDVLRGAYRVFNSPVNPFASNSELRPPPTPSTLPIHSPQGDIFRSEIVVAEDMKIEADMKARMKTKVISALSACIYNLMECFGLAGFLMVLVIPWMVVLLGFKFSEEGAGMGEDEAQREGDGVLEGRCDPLSGDEDTERFTLSAPHQQEEDKEETDFVYLKQRVMASSGEVQDFKAEHELKDPQLQFDRDPNSINFVSSRPETELMSVANIRRGADIKSEAVDFELADVNTKVSSMTVADLDEDTITGADFILAPVVVNFVETGRRQSLIGQHHDLGSVNARASLLSEFEDPPAENMNMTTGFVEHEAGFGVIAADEELQKTAEEGDDILSEAESYATAEDSEIVTKMEVEDMMVCTEQPIQMENFYSDGEFMTRIDEPDKEDGSDFDDTAHVFPGSFPRVGVSFLLTSNLSLPMWSTRNYWFVFAGAQLEQPSEEQGDPLPSEPVAFGLPRSGSPMETAVPLVAYLTPPQSSAKMLPSSPPAVPRGRKTRLKESLMKDREKKGRMSTIRTID